MSPANSSVSVPRKWRLYVALIIVWAFAGALLNSQYGDAPITTHWGKRWWDGEASAHFLNTLARYHHNPVNQHYYAPGAAPFCTPNIETPCVRHGEANKRGSAMVTSDKLDGEVVYTSFPPGAMIISSAVVYPLSNVIGVPPLTSLRAWNWALALITAILLSFVLRNVIDQKVRHREILIFFACMPLLISVESLHSHHLTMWAHQMYQPIMALTLLVLTVPMRFRTAFLLGVICAIGCWVEWTAYFVCVAVFFMVILQSRSGEKMKNVTVFSVTALTGGLALLLYYSWLVGLPAYFTSLESRFSARTFTVNYYTWKDWMWSLYQSYGPWLIAVVVLIAMTKWQTIDKQERNSSISRIQWGLIFVVAIALLENVLMFEHAIVYTFDRLKWGFLLGVAIAIGGERLLRYEGRKAVILIGSFATMASIASVIQFMHIYRPYWK